MSAPAGQVPVPDHDLLVTCVRILPFLRATAADATATEAERGGARIALECVRRVIEDIRRRS